MELRVQLSGSYSSGALAHWPKDKVDMNRAVLAGTLAATLLVGGAIAQAPTDNQNDRRERIAPRQLSAEQDHIIKENLKDMHIEHWRQSAA